ncbi:MAG: dTDP-glucose 4,6-dehydratase [Candidatus Omnitrophota bacterium]
MNILVTGGAGFIGSHFVKHLLKTYKNYHVINLDKLTYSGNLDNLKELRNDPRHSFIRGDICNAKLVADIMKKCSMVVHFAAETHVDRSIKDGSDFVRTNVLGTHTLLQAAYLAGVKRFVHVSTDEVYGSRKSGFFKETDALNPSSPYSASKASSDMLARSYFTTYGMDVVITRCSNNFGPNQYPEKVVPLFVTNLLEGKKVPLYGTGKNVRDWIYVEDHCRGVDMVMHKGKAGEIYNIAGENYLDNLRLTKVILKIMGCSSTMIQPVADRLGHDFRYAIDCSKIRKLGFHPQVPFDDGIHLTVDWYKKNTKWWGRLK